MSQELLQAVVETCQQIPDYEYYFDGDHIETESKQLADDHPDSVRIDKIGESAGGRDIDMLTIGDLESEHAITLLIKNLVHPNEGIGTLTTDFLTKHLAAHPELLQILGYDRANVVSNADRDGYALQEWPGKPFTVTSYFKGFYRPPRERQVCFGYPYIYEDLKTADGLPESLAVAQVIEKEEPDYMAALHNAALGRSYMYVDRQPPPFASLINSWLSYCDLKPSTGPVETPFATKWAPGLYANWSAEEKHAALNPDGKNPIIRVGSDHFLKKVNSQAMHIDTELPYFNWALLEDDGMSGMLLSEATKQGIQTSTEQQNLIGEVLGTLGANKELRDHPFYVATQSQHKLVNKSLAANKRLDHSSKEATVSEMAKELHVPTFYSLTQIGQIARLAFLAGETNLGADLHSHIDNELQNLEAIGGKIKPIPPRQLAVAQVGLVLISAALASPVRSLGRL